MNAAEFYSAAYGSAENYQPTMKTCIEFNPYPDTKPDGTCNYIVLFKDGLTDSHCWDGEDWVHNEYSNDTVEGVVGWADFPFVAEDTEMYYVLFIWNDIEPELIGPFDTEDERNRAALQTKRERGDSHGYFMLESTGPVDINPYGGGFFSLK